MNEPTVNWVYLGNVAIFTMIFQNEGDCNEGHAHTYDHPTLVCRGAVSIISNGKTTEFKENEIIAIPAGVTHLMIAKVPNTMVACIHALHDRKTGIVVDPKMIPEGTPPWSFSVPILEKDARAQDINVEDFREIANLKDR
jgi:hypothetical protein